MMITLDTIEYDFESYALQHGIPETVDPLPYRKTGSVFSDYNPDQQQQQQQQQGNNDTSNATTTGSSSSSDNTNSNNNSNNNNNMLTSAKYDPRLRTVVCRHWLRDLCMKGTACEFLHQYDLIKMPLCRHGDRCKIKDCPFRHISDIDRLECAFYKSGFCIHGPFCRYKHMKRSRDDLPIVADFALGLSQMQQAALAAGLTSSTTTGIPDGTLSGIGSTMDNKSMLLLQQQQQQQTRRPAPKPNEFYKISLCKHYMAGDCPFGDHCHFAHGEHELKTYPRKGQQQQQNQNSSTADAGEDATTSSKSEQMLFGDTTTTNTTNTATAATSGVDYFGGDNNNNNATIHGNVSHNGRPCPVVHEKDTSYFILSASTQRDVAIATVRKEWYVQSSDAKLLNSAYGSFMNITTTTATTTGATSHTAAETSQLPKVILFFTVANSRHIQAVAMMTSLCMYQSTLDYTEKSSTNTKNSDNHSTTEGPYCYRFTLDWYRTIEFPLSAAISIAPDFNTPMQTLQKQHELQTSSCQSLIFPTGEAIMKALWNAPLVTLYESWSDDIPIVVPDQHGMDLRAPITDDEIPWPIMPGPGYIFGCSSDTMDECLGLGIFGLPAHMQASASQIHVGTTVFLFNVTDRLLFGIFEALTPAIMNIVPTAFSKNPKATTSPFPVQIRIRISLECPPLEDSDPVLNDILRVRGRGRIGPLTYAQSEAIASLLANQCGALQYMLDYQNGIRTGATVRTPPIALPPKKLVRKDTTTNSSITANGAVTATPPTNHSTAVKMELE